MSKQLRLIIAGILVLLTAVGLWWYFKSQNSNSGLVQKEISIEQADISSDNYLTHQNFAGFSFEYPDNLTLKETELDSSTVYAAVELTAANGEMINLRIYDDQFADLDEWLNNFEAENVVVDMSNVLWSDLSAKSFEAGTPRKLITVAVEDGVVYRLESSVGSSFIKSTHEHLISSFKFNQTVNAGATVEVPAEVTDDNITLIEEIIE